MSNLSKRLNNHINDSTAMPYYLKTHIEMNNKDANYIPLCISENFMMFDILQEKLNSEPQLNVNLTCYNDMNGTPEFRQAVAAFMNKRIIHKYSLHPDNIIIANGCSSIIRMLGECICDQNDVILTSAPYYIGFDLDLDIVGVEVIGVQMKEINLDKFRQGYENAVKLNKNVRAILLTNPNNPTGEIVSKKVLKDIVEWVNTLDNVHLIIDEIYALSIFSDKTKNNEHKEEERFISIGDVVTDLKDNIHIVWGFSKDFCMSGFRCGVLYTENKEMIEYCQYVSIWHSVSTLTQKVLYNIITDDVFMEKYIDTLQQRLYDRYHTVLNVLEKYQIPYIPSNAGLFMIVDLRKYLSHFNNSEYELWKFIVDNCSVNISNGEAYHMDTPGYFRVCFCSNPEQKVIDALNRVFTTLNDMKK